MKKTTKLSVCAFLGLGLVVYGQNNGRVGINTPNPKATLEVSKDGTDTAKGIIIPRLTAEEVKAMTDAGNIGTEQHSLLVYVTEAFTNTLDRVGKYELISGKGYYYWDNQLTGGKWKKLLDTDNFYTAGAGIKLSGNTFSRTGLEEITENGNTGFRLIGANPDHYGDIGKKAVDLSYSYNYKRSDYGATGSYSFASGISSIASGYISTSMGGYSIASGQYSFALGRWALASASGAIALGGDAIASGGNTIALGNFITAQTPYSTVLGNNNFNTDPSMGGDTPTFTKNRYELFVLGNGDNTIKQGGDQAIASNAFIVLRDGSTGIGLAREKPTEMIDANGTARLRTINLLSGQPTDKIVVSDANGVLKTVVPSSINNIYTADGTLSSTRQVNLNGKDLSFTGTGNVGIGTNAPQTKLDITGSIKITDGTQQEGRVLTSDANGIASWQALSMGNKMAKINFSNRNFNIPTVSHSSSSTLTPVKEVAETVTVDFNEFGATYTNESIRLSPGKYMFFVNHDLVGVEYCRFLVNATDASGTRSVYLTYYGEWLNTSFPLVLSKDTDITFHIIGFADDTWVDDGSTRNMPNPNPRFYLKSSNYTGIPFSNQVTILKLN
ncbi:hypothetical protein JSO54_05170 [Riemerella anatipestifer]|uniref:hypothetical protein n=1 Tax=Riemerella anatipestifer TaxID=34085 RepID=UPI0030C1204A